ncbi:MAG: glucosaminidase domain-containing protein [Saprospiraceae bacterium]|nr:glucosaminidase domain-containing protein [Saprospiraceae bacterium]
MERYIAQLLHFLRKNWFKVCFVGFVLFILTQKDLSFNIHLQSPAKPKKEVVSPVNPPPAKPSKKERLADAGEPDKPDEAGLTDRFDFSALGQSSSAKGGPTDYDRLKKLDEGKISRFIQRFARVSMNERRKYGIPSSIILANGLLLSRAGQRSETREGHNYFQITCSSDWKGATGNHRGICFRHYDNAWTSFRDHSLYLTSGKLAHLRNLGKADYKSWARELEKEGFYPGQHYARQVVQLIEEYSLFKFDQD